MISIRLTDREKCSLSEKGISNDRTFPTATKDVADFTPMLSKKSAASPSVDRRSRIWRGVGAFGGFIRHFAKTFAITYANNRPKCTIVEKRRQMRIDELKTSWNCWSLFPLYRFSEDSRRATAKRTTVCIHFSQIDRRETRGRREKDEGCEQVDGKFLVLMKQISWWFIEIILLSR